MAEFDGLDDLLRGALGRAAEPGDSSGVADAIRSRVSSGDPGFPVAGPTVPGWGGRTLRWLIGVLVIGVLIIGGASGIAIGLAGSPGSDPAIPTASPASSAPSPSPTPSVSPTANPTETPTPVPTLPPAPAPAPPPPPADTSPPTVTASASGSVWIANGGGTTITAAVADDRGVVAVNVSWSGAATGSAPMTLSGGQWTYDYAPQPGMSPGSLTFVATAVDAAGNAGSGSVTVPVGM